MQMNGAVPTGCKIRSITVPGEIGRKVTPSTFTSYSVCCLSLELNECDLRPHYSHWLV